MRQFLPSSSFGIRPRRKETLKTLPVRDSSKNLMCNPSIEMAAQHLLPLPSFISLISPRTNSNTFRHVMTMLRSNRERFSESHKNPEEYSPALAPNCFSSLNRGAFSLTIPEANPAHFPRSLRDFTSHCHERESCSQLGPPPRRSLPDFPCFCEKKTLGFLRKTSVGILISEEWKRTDFFYISFFFPVSCYS